jgi:hypothetical protein
MTTAITISGNAQIKFVEQLANNSDSNPYLSAAEQSLSDEFFNIINKFSTATDWDQIIFTSIQDIKTGIPDYTNNTIPYSLQLKPDLTITQEMIDGKKSAWSKIGSMTYSAMREKDCINCIACANINEKNDLMSMCTQSAYTDVFKKICLNVCNTVTDKAYLDNKFDILINDILLTLSIVGSEQGQSYITLQNFLNNCKNKVYDNDSYTLEDRKIFLVCFKPFLIACYIMSFIRINNVDEKVNQYKPSSLMIQLLACTAYRMYIIETILVLVQLTTSTDASNMYLIVNYEIQAILKMISNDSNEFSSLFKDLRELIQKNQDSSVELQKITTNLDAAKANLEKAVHADASLEGSLKKSNMFVILWIVLVVCLIITAAVLGFLTYKKHDSLYAFILFGVAGAICVGVLVNLFVMAIRST